MGFRVGRTGRGVRVAIAATLLAAAGPAVGAGPAAGEVGWPTPTAQAVAMETEFLVDPAFPPAAPAAVCEIDSGIADGAVAELGAGQVTRYAMREDDPVLDTHAEQHGTWMARYMGAALDGIGMVGIWPGVRIVSVRALVGEGQEFAYSVYKGAIAACLRLRATGVPIVAISLSLGGSAAPAFADVAKLVNAIGDARDRDVVVFAAAGNQPGPVLSPAREPGVVGVGAGNARVDDARGRGVGQPCAGSAGGPPYSAAGRDLLAPGCFLDGGTPDGVSWVGAGSSQATSMTAALYAAARAYAPAVPAADAERALLETSQAPGQGGWVSGRRLFAALGLDWQRLVRPAATVQGDATRPVDPPPSAEPAGVAARYPRPALTLRRRRGRVLTVAVAARARPVGASLYVRALDGRRRVLARRLSGRRSSVGVTLPFGTRSVDVRYRDEGRHRPDSPAARWTANVRRPRTWRHRDGSEFR